jgi:hypothetical protein
MRSPNLITPIRMTGLMVQARRPLYYVSQGPDVLLQTDLEEKNVALIRVIVGESKLGFGL